MLCLATQRSLPAILLCGGRRRRLLRLVRQLLRPPARFRHPCTARLVCLSSLAYPLTSLDLPLPNMAASGAFLANPPFEPSLVAAMAAHMDALLSQAYTCTCIPTCASYHTHTCIPTHVHPTYMCIIPTHPHVHPTYMCIPTSMCILPTHVHTYLHMDALLSQANSRAAVLTFVVVIPTWPEEPCWQALQTSPHAAA